jgi:uncharacterized membrane protein
MHFASPFPLWLVVVLAAGVVGVAALAYRRPLAPLTRGQRVGLAVLRGLSLASLLLVLARPTVLRPPGGSRDIVVPVLVDVSRSMRLADGSGGRTRLAEATRRLTADLLPALSRQFKPDVYSFGESLAPASVDTLSADARRSDLSGALDAVKERYRGRPIAGIVVLTDGAETGETRSPEAAPGSSVPVYPIGVGSTSGPPDREVLGLSAGDPRLDAATVDLKVTATTRGFGREPFQLRVLADGRLLESRRLVPAADGSPVDAEFTVLPNPLTATVYTAEIAAEPGEAITENNQRSVLVSPAGRKRRLLAIEGAPGFDHSFMARALSADPGLELDTVVRKGKNDTGQDTFFVQAGGGRAAKLTTGFPATREALFAYDGLIIANLESDFFSRAQLQLAADFVSERGGGVLVLGGRSFAQRGLIGTPLEEVLPVELSDRRGGLARASLDPDRMPRHHGVALTSEGESHPVMRIAPTPADTARVWSAMPDLASAAQLGGPRPGAQVLAVTATGGGAIVPLVAVQRYGRGRSMVFAGEGAWRWRMLQASTDRSYEFFWRQAARWVSGAAQDPVSIVPPEGAEPGDALVLGVDARDAGYASVADAAVSATLTLPGGETLALPLRRDATTGRYTAAFRPERSGLYRMRAEARRGTASLGTADRWFYVGGGDREFADPRLNEGVLRRVARASGGRYGQADEASEVASWLEAAAPGQAEPERRDLWHEPWAFLLLIAILSAEWVLRRRWGLR